MRAREIITHHDVMTCPVCGIAIRATVVVLPHLGTPAIDPDGRSVTVPVQAEMTRFNIEHICAGGDQ